MDYVQVSNFRAFRDPNKLEIKPVTILLGKNGVGKSSLIRLLPMLKQSMESSTNGFLWFGSYVDFGSFNDIKNNKKLGSGDVYFELMLDCKEGLEQYDFNRFLKKRDDNKITFGFHIAGKDGLGSYIRKVEVKDLDLIFELDQKFKIKEVTICGFKYAKNLFPVPAPYKLIPILRAFSVYSKKDEVANRSDYIRRLLFKGLRAEEAYDADIFDVELFTNLEKFKKSKLGRKLKSSSHLREDLESLLLEFYSTLVCRKMYLLTSLFDGALQYYFSSIKYIAPVRAYIERYYRYQELSVKEVDPKGANIAIILNSLSSDEMKRFNIWTEEALGFSIYSKQIGAHIELFIKNLETKEECNLADTGFGYSQILPVLVQVWSSIEALKNRNYRDLQFNHRFRFSKRSSLIVIEQPELHLHPHFQAQLIEMFVNAYREARKYGILLKFAIETHSETFVETVGRMVSQKQLTPLEVSLNFVEKDTDGNSQVIKAEYKEDGSVENWPIGFFSAG